MNKELKNKRTCIIISLLIFICATLISFIQTAELNLQFNIQYLQIVLYLISYFIVGINVLKEAFESIFKGQVLDENFLMTLATIGAFATKEFPEAVMVMWLYQVGELFQSYAVGKSKASIAELMSIRPDYANIEKDGKIIEVSPEEVKVGEKILVKPGEKIPLDGIIIKGESTIDTAMLTGETIPRKVKEGVEVYSGSINNAALLEIKVTKSFANSTVSKILELVENASHKKAKAENFIRKFAKYYTPIVVIIALCLAVFPPLIISNAEWLDYIHRACSFLVISCPCALVISIPLGFFGGIGGASKLGILIKGSNYIEALSKAKIAVFDKTGTLTKGTFEVNQIEAVGITKEELLEKTALVEAYSNHPIALSIKVAYGKKIDVTRVSNVEEISGCGIKAKVDGEIIYVGNKKLIENIVNEININEKFEKESVGTDLYVASENKYLGSLTISDVVKSDAKNTIKELKYKTKIEEVIMLTGDREVVAKQVSNELGIDKYYANLLPIDKVEKVENILENLHSSQGLNSKEKYLLFIGDGVNDAPVLTRADIGIAMGGLGSDAAIEAADIVIMDDEISKIPIAIELAKRTIRIVKQNIVFALSVKLIILILGALGIANMWEAVFADVGVSFIAIINSMRAMRVEKFIEK